MPCTMPCDADVDPRAGRHLAVHHQALAIELVEVLPGRPVRHEVGVGDQHARRVGVGAEHADRLARLHQQRLVVLEPLAASRRCGRSCPSRAPRGRCRHRRRAPRAARRPRGRGCSSASAAAPRSASSWRCSCVPRGGADDAAIVERGFGHGVFLAVATGSKSGAGEVERRFEDTRQRGWQRLGEICVVRCRPVAVGDRALRLAHDSRGRRAPSAARGRRAGPAVVRA